MQSRISRGRLVLLVAGLACTLGAASVVPHYAWGNALQYALIGVAGPALCVLSAPWRLAGRADPAGSSMADRAARSWSRRSGGLESWGLLAAFMAAAIVWRLPPVVDTLARHPVLVLAELVTLFPAGCALWLELVASPPLLPRTARPQRALFAAVSMWTIWVLAYVMGFSHAGWSSVYAHGGPALSAAADQQIAAGVLWAVPALSFTGVVFSSLIGWLGDSSDPDAELRDASAATEGGMPAPAPPRGWRTRSARRPAG
jgi:cytochrome c oxidase assembly factor CtaG